MDSFQIAAFTTIGFMAGCLFMLGVLLLVKRTVENAPRPTDPEDQLDPIYLTEEEQKQRTEELRKIAGKINRNRTMWD